MSVVLDDMLRFLRHLSILAFFILLYALSCTEENRQTINFSSIGHNYYPDSTGNWIVYEVEQIIIDAPSARFDTTHFFIKEVIAEKYYDAENRPTIRIERYYKENPNGNWKILDVWAANKLNTSLQIVEENIRYIKLVFPPALYKRWDGNAFNMLDSLHNEYYEITQIDLPEEINNISFDSVLHVTQRNEESLIHKEYAVEKYAKNTGLVYKKDISIYSDSIIPGVSVEERVQTGTFYTQIIVEFYVQ